MIVYPGQRSDGKSSDSLYPATSAGHVDISCIKERLKDTQQASNGYFRRLETAYDWWQSRWEGQTVDGRKWWKLEGQPDTFPWPGSSDARLRFCKQIVNQYKTICLYALMNMKLQARSARPEASGHQSGQATTMINWQIYTHMLEEWYRESELAIVWSGAMGASMLSVDWEQERRLDHVTINIQQFGSFVSQTIGQPLSLPELTQLLQDSQYEDELVQITQQLSEVLSKSDARKIVKDMRKTGTAEVPVPYLFRNKPRIVALRPLIDVYFPLETDDPQRVWIDRVEYVYPEQLEDRVHTDNYDPKFVEDALKQRGNFSDSPAGMSEYLIRGLNFLGTNIILPGGAYASATGHDIDDRIELHHCYHFGSDNGIPCPYRTVYHYALDEEALHIPLEYKHGQQPFHAIRFDTDLRPILSSMGIPETIYTWEFELKTQTDARTDRASITLAPPMFAAHQDAAKMKRNYFPNAIIPTLPGREFKFAETPPYDQGPVEISEDIKQRAREYFGWFGEIDQQLKQMRQMELVDRISTQFKPIVSQIGELIPQFVEDDVWVRVTGSPPPAGSRTREEIQGQYEITLTCDLRELDMEYNLKKAQMVEQILPMDTTGVVDRTVVITELMESISYTLADMSIRSSESVTAKESADELSKVSMIIGSGIEQPMPPPGSNFNLRLQVFQNTIQSTPFIKQRVAQAPDVLKVLENRYLYLTRQIQQTQNAQIGKTQVGQTFNPSQAPALAPPSQ